MSAGVSACPSCGASRDSATGPCPACGAVTGDDNRCPSCGAHAAVREIAPGAYACMACGADRPRLPGTHVAADFGAALEHRARSARLASRLAYVVAGLSAVGGAALALLLRVLSVDLGALVIGVAAGVLSLAAYAFGRGRAREADRVADGALERRLLSVAAATDTGVTAATAARAVGQAPAAVDDALSALAKRGRVDMDVDDEGTIRYRVASAELEDDGLDDDAVRASRRHR